MKNIMMILCVFLLSESCSQRTVHLGQKKLMTQQTVASYGAVGNGKADDTGAIQSAIDAGVNPIVFDHGIYKIELFDG